MAVEPEWESGEEFLVVPLRFPEGSVRWKPGDTCYAQWPTGEWSRVRVNAASVEHWTEDVATLKVTFLEWNLTSDVKLDQLCPLDQAAARKIVPAPPLRSEHRQTALRFACNAHESLSLLPGFGLHKRC